VARFPPSPRVGTGDISAFSSQPAFGFAPSGLRWRNKENALAITGFQSDPGFHRPCHLGGVPRVIAAAGGGAITKRQRDLVILNGDTGHIETGLPRLAEIAIARNLTSIPKCPARPDGRAPEKAACALIGAGTTPFGAHPPCRPRLAGVSAAGSRDGCTEAIMMAHGFTVEMPVDLVRAGLATAKAERVVAGGRAIEVARVRITEAGRRALADAAQEAPSRAGRVES
jgi:hypothetical protein